MRLVCPSCEAKYEVPDDAIPDTGRDVQCANCGHAWFQMRARAATAVPEAGEAVAPLSEPVPESLPEPLPVAEAGLPGPDMAAGMDQTSDAGSDADGLDDGSDAGPEGAEAAMAPKPEAGESAPEPEVAEPEVAEPEVAEPEVAEPEVSEPAEMADLATSATDRAQDALSATEAGPAEPNPATDAALTDAFDGAAPDQPAPGTGATAALDADLPKPASETSAIPDAAEIVAAAEEDAAQEASNPDAVAKAAAAAVATGAAAYAVDESVLAILREEAEREANARKADAQSLETQTDMGLAAGLKKKKSVAKDEAKTAARRDLLPDVEEINSTLRPSEPDADAELLGAAGSMSGPARQGFRGGFLAVMTVAILCATLYVLAPRLEAMVPALSGPLQAYAGVIDGLRLHLDGMMQSATVAINGG
jgi:resuscitation-promoting factor RpfA